MRSINKEKFRGGGQVELVRLKLEVLCFVIETNFRSLQENHEIETNLETKNN